MDATRRPNEDHLARLVLESDMEANLQAVAELAVRSVAGCDFAGITLMRRGRAETSVFTDPISPEIDSAQYESGEGPCLDAYRNDDVYRIADMETESRWPAFVRAAKSQGIHSTISLPLPAGADEAMGALNLYSRATGRFTDDEEVRVFASQAAVVLANARALAAANKLVGDLEAAMASRATIEQAKGIIIASRRCTPDEAFALLRQQSQHENRKLRDVAREIVIAGTGPCANRTDGPLD